MSGRFSIEAFFKAIDGFSAPVGKMQANFVKFAAAGRQSASQLNAATNSIAGGLKTVGAMAGVAAVAGGAALIGMAGPGADFEKAMAAVGAVSLMTRDQVLDLEKQARSLGTTTKFSATEVAGAMELAGKAGFSNKEILQSMPGVLAAAAAEGMDLSESMGIVSNTLKGMGLAADQTTRVADVLTLASARTNSSIKSLGESMALAAPAAHLFHVPLEQVVASVASLQDVGLDASTAGTAVSTMLSKLAKPTTEVSAKMRALGVTFQDSKGNMLPFTEVLGNLGKAVTKSKGNMGAAAFMTDLLGLRGEKAGLLLDEAFKTGKFQALTKELENAAGSAQKMADLRLQNFSDQFLILRHKAEDLGITLYDLAGPSLHGVIDSMNKWVDANKELIVSDVKSFAQGVSAHMGEIVKWGERIGKMAAPFLALGAAVKVVAAAQAIWNAAALASPLTLLILGITAAVGLIIAFWPEISAFFGRVWAGLKSISSRIAGAVGGFLSTAWETVKGFLAGAADFVVGLIVLSFMPLTMALKAIWPIVQPVFAAIGDAAAAAGEVFMSVWRPVSAFFSELWGEAMAGFSRFGAFIASAAAAAVAKFQELWAPIGEFFSGLWTTVADGFKSAFGWVLDKIAWAVAAVEKLGHTALFGSPPTGDGAEGGGAADGPQVIPPRMSLSSDSVQEINSTSRGEVTIRDQSGRATITKAPTGGGFGLSLKPSYAL